MKIRDREGREFTIAEAIAYELTPDSYSLRKRKERVADTLAAIIQAMVDRKLLTVAELDAMMNDLIVEE